MTMSSLAVPFLPIFDRNLFPWRTDALNGTERRSVALLFWYGFGNAGAYVLARTTADSAFLSQIGPDRLPQLYMLAAGVVALASLVYGHTVQKIGLRRTTLSTLGVLAFASLILPAAMIRHPRSITVFALAYLLAQVRGTLGTIQYATMLNEQFSQRQPERVVGLVGAGATLAGILVGVLIGFLSKRIGVENFLYLAAVIDLLTMVPVSLLSQSRKAMASLPPIPPPGNPDSISNGAPEETIESPNRIESRLRPTIRFRDLRRSSYVMLIAAAVVFCIFATTLVEFQWKVIAATEFQRDSAMLARYFGFFYGSVYFVTGLLQLFVTGRVLQRRGLLAGLLAFPIALLAATFTALAATTSGLLLTAMTLSKGCDTLKRGLNDPSIQILYSPMEIGLRRQAIAFVAGIAKPFAEAIAAISLVVLTPWISTRQLSPLIIGLILLWLIFDIPAWREFSRLRSAGQPNR